MPKSGSRSKPRNYLARREQWRLLLMVMTLGLVIVLMMEASNPKNYPWLFGTAQDEDASAPAPKRPADAPPIDDRVVPKPPVNELPGTFFSPAPVDPDAPEDTSGEYFPGVKPKLLEQARDNTTFRYDERHAWFNLLGVLRKTPEPVLEKASLGRVSYFQLFEQSNEYRGKLVTIRGRIHRVLSMRAPRNDAGIERYYQLVVQPEDAPDYPIIVYCLELPDGFPTGERVLEDAKITGFYFKRWAYPAKNALRTAPTLVAKTLCWIETPTSSQTSLGLGSVLFVVVAAAAFAVFAATYIYTRTRRDTTGRPETAPALDALKDIELAPGGERPPDAWTDKQD